MPDLTLVIGNKNYSSWSLRPWILMKYFNIDFKEERVALFTETTDEFLAPYNSNYKVPVLVDGDITVWDSLSIMEYLSECYLDYSAWPDDVEAWALARSVSAEMHSSFADMRNELPMNCRKRFENYRYSAAAAVDIQRITDIWRKCRTEFGGGGEWLFGRFSIADAMFAPVALRFSGYCVPLGDLEGAYVESLLELPAMTEWIESGRQETEVIERDEVKI